jgi:type IX secretion system PorP/SprF family membrane protein
MRYAKSLVLLSLIVLGTGLSAQQLPMFSQYLNNGFVVNPAMAGTEKFAPLRFVVRDQWTGIEGGPMTQTLSYHNSFMKDKMGIGAYLFNDKFGTVSRTGLSATYAYIVNFSEESKLSFGVSGLFYLYRLNTSNLQFESSNNTDPVLYTGDFKAFSPNASFGMLYSGKNYSLGLAIPELIPVKISPSKDFYVVQQQPHYYFTAGYKLKLSDNTTLEPGILLKHVKGAPTQLDFNASLRIKNMVNIGATYRTDDAVAIMASYLIKEKYLIGYSYDMTISGLKTFAKGTHEIVLGINLSKKKAVENPETPPPDNIIMPEEPKKEDIPKPDDSPKSPG